MSTPTPDRPTPADLRERRKALSLSQGACARIAGVTTRSWQRWEAGDQDIPPWTDMFMRGLECEAGIRTAPAPPP
ncbi:MAG: helix-turn-helix domain-containing protein [Gemmatimonadetes bacterium]|nr:helix-turn-helix domain-containing protein [Gemmatimonadota bacterium]